MTTETESPPLATDEAEEAEADEPQPEPIEGPDEPAPRAPRPDPADLIQKSERANESYTKRLRAIWGEDVTLYDCAHCNGLGVTFEPEADDAVPSDVVHPENLETCPTCNGYGEVITGSKNPQHITTICTACAARGYIAKAAPAAAATPLPLPQPAEPQPQAGQWVPGRGFIPYGATEPLPNTAGLA